MKTAMKQLEEWVIQKWSDPGKLISCLEVVVKIEQMYEEEKHQIVKAYDDGKYNGEDGTIREKYIYGEQYYNQTYNNEIENSIATDAAAH